MTEREEHDHTGPGDEVEEAMPGPEGAPDGTLGREDPADEPGNAGTVREHVGDDDVD